MIIKHDKTITLIFKRIAKITMVNGRELIRVKRAKKQEANIHLIDVNEDIWSLQLERSEKITRALFKKEKFFDEERLVESKT